MAFCCQNTLANPFKPLINFTSEQLADNLYVLKSERSNTNVGVFIGQEYIVLIDPVVGKANNSVLVSAIQAFSDKPIKYVINTHSHPDHNGANAFYIERGATIILHTNLAADNQTAFQADYSLDLGNETINLFSFVSHSKDDVIIQFVNSNVIFMGDTYMHNIYPHAYVGGSAGLYRVIDKTLTMTNDDSKIITAHGSFVTTKPEFLNFQKNAKAWYQRINQLKDEMTIEEIAMDEKLIAISKSFRDLSMPNLKQRLIRTIHTERAILNGL